MEKWNERMPNGITYIAHIYGLQLLQDNHLDLASDEYIGWFSHINYYMQKEKQMLFCADKWKKKCVEQQRNRDRCVPTWMRNPAAGVLFSLRFTYCDANRNFAASRWSQIFEINGNLFSIWNIWIVIAISWEFSWIFSAMLRRLMLVVGGWYVDRMCLNDTKDLYLIHKKTLCQLN